MTVDFPLARSLPSALRVVRWTTIGLVFLLAVAEPLRGRADLPLWSLVLAFAVYNLALDLLARSFAWFRSFSRIAILDLAASGGVYLLASEYGGLAFVLVFLVVVCAAATLSFRGSILCVAAASAIVIVIEPTLHERPSAAEAIRDLGARTIILALVAVGATTLVRRLTAEQEASRAVRLEAERMAELNHLRTTFISSVSHDLQTPLTAVRAGLGLLEASLVDRLREEERHLLTNSRRNVDHLGLQINDLLTFNQLEAHALQLDPIPFDLRATVTDAIAVVHPLLRQKDQTLEIDIADPLLVNGDPRRLEQVVINLLVNAHRHTPAGTRITVSGRTATDEVLLTVADDGPGIPPETRDRIFERFQRLSPAGEGSGLGLAIVKAVVELHRGRIWVESPDERGVAFRVGLPRAVEDASPCR